MTTDETEHESETETNRFDRRTVLQAGAVGVLGSAVLSGPAGAHPDGWDDMSLDEQLEVVQEATEAYEDDLEAAADADYVSESPLICGMGFHYVNPDFLGDPLHPERPEALVYTLSEGGDLALGAVEYILPDPDGEMDNPGTVNGGLFNDSGDAETEGWVYVEHLEAWTLHVWVHEENDNGVFAPFNPAFNDMPGCL